MSTAQDALNREMIADSCLVIVSHARRIEQRASETETMPDYEPVCMAQLKEAARAIERAWIALAEKQNHPIAAE